MIAAEDASAAMPWGAAISTSPLAERADNSPTAEVGSGSDRERAGELDPERHVRVGGDGSVGDQGEEDDAHGLLSVVGAVGEGNE